MQSEIHGVPPHAVPQEVDEPPQHASLDVFIGTWELTGRAFDAPFVREGALSGRETFEWYPGRTFLIHRLEGEHAGASIACTDITRYDVATMMFSMSAFYSDGTHRVMKAREVGGTWTYDGELEVAGHELQNRCTVTFEDGGAVRISRWEYSNDGETWHVYWETTARRIAAPAA
jgi:hypothetical protein